MAVNTRNDFYINLASGKGIITPFEQRSPTGNVTAGAAASGFFTCFLSLVQATQNQPGTLTSILFPPGLSAQAMLSLCMATTGLAAGRATYLAYFYKIGTLVLTATGNQFTHDAATFPVTRTQFGAATKPVALVPLLYITTATTTTAAQFILKNSAPSAGYTNQDGATITGTKTHTLPAAATAVSSAYILRLEEGDSAVQDVTQIDITVAASAGAASVYGVELLAPLGTLAGPAAFISEALLGGLHLNDLRPAAATSGSVTSFLGLLQMGSPTGSLSSLGFLQGALAA
jgi:hypothetical protein